MLLLDEFGNPIPVLDDEGNPLREVLSVHSPRFDAAVGWINDNLGPAVPEPSALALSAVLLTSMAGLRLRGRFASLRK